MTRDATLPPDDQARLLASLSRPAVYDGNVQRVELLQTHISYVLLTGRYAYKIKKAVDLGFLDFTTLASRKYYCEQELRLNRRLAPAIYLDVVAITGSVDAPEIGGQGPIIEYAVKMREFPQDALLSRVLARGALTAAQIDTLAVAVASFHARVAVADADAPFGVPGEILRRALQNFDQLRPLVDDAAERATLDELSEWTQRKFAGRLTLFERRRSGGFIRECHGDLHLGNIALVDGELTIFDCIEFDEQLRWIDVMSEVAFTVMELQNRQRADLGYRFLNAYLEITGDYEGAGVLRFYLAYRAMVRAKVRRMRAAQLPAGDDRSVPLAEYRGYERLARDYARPPRPAIVITHGLAGCGKTTLSQALLEQIGAVRIRTDVERKRIHGLAAEARSRSGIDSGLYTMDATQQTYRHVCALARNVVTAGYVAIIDGAFLKRWQRDLFRALAGELAVPFVIVAFAASETTLRKRVAQRSQRGTDASEASVAVLEQQLQTQDALATDERANAVAYDAELSLEHARLPQAWRGVVERIGVETAPPSDSGAADPGIDAKVAFLSRAKNYPEPTDRVEVIETHLSWVFLTDRYAYKLKKPVRLSYLDLSTEIARQLNCIEELRLNRRLARDVYLDGVPLSVDDDGEMRLGADGRAIDWLVRMHRLPADRMLDHAIRNGSVRVADIHSVLATLCRFYRDCTPVTIAPTDYRERLAAGIAEQLRELSRPDYRLPIALVESICARQRAVLQQGAAMFDERVRAGRIVEGHGDLRPEHISLGSPPQIIDCLEFSLEFRSVDTADELGFLALECERLGAPGLRQPIFAIYRELTGDEPPEMLVHFYQSYRAMLRAKLAVWHLEGPARGDRAKWDARARGYLRLAREHIEQCR